MFIDQQYIFFGCLILFFFILGVIIFVNKDKKSMEPKRKLEIDPVFTLIVVDSNAYQTHKQRISKLESGKFSREVFIKEMTEELLNGLAASTSKKTQDKYFTLKKMFDLYDYQIDYLSMLSQEKKHLISLLTKIRNDKAIKDFEENYILDLSFFHNCVVTLNDSWYLQLGIPLSGKFVKSQKQQNLILRQIYDFEQVDKILEPITINKARNSGISFLKDFAKEEFFGVINPNPFLGSDHPINIELENILLMKKIITENPSYELAVFYSPS